MKTSTIFWICLALSFVLGGIGGWLAHPNNETATQNTNVVKNDTSQNAIILAQQKKIDSLVKVGKIISFYPKIVFVTKADSIKYPNVDSISASRCSETVITLFKAISDQDSVNTMLLAQRKGLSNNIDTCNNRLIKNSIYSQNAINTVKKKADFWQKVGLSTGILAIIETLLLIFSK